MEPRHARDLSPLDVTEMVLRFARLPKPPNKGLVVNKPIGGMSRAGRLFQAKMWRGYAAEWGLPEYDIRRRWVEKVLNHDRADCIRRARVNLYLERRMGRSS